MEAAFSLTGEDDAERIEGVETFKYLGRILDWSDNDCPAVFQNVGKAHLVWIHMGKLLRGGDVGSTSVCHVLSGSCPGSPTFGVRELSFLESMSRKLEGLHVGFLRKITGQRAMQRKDETWRRVAS